MRRKALYLLLITIPLTIATIHRPLADELRGTFFSVTGKLFSYGEQLNQKIQNTGTDVRNVLFVYSENEQLKKRVAQMESSLISLDELAEENLRLRALLEFKQKTIGDPLPARVIGRDVTQFGNWLLLDKGSRDGIHPDMAVVSENGVVGKVIEVGAKSARAILLTDLDARAAAVVQRTRVVGLVAGDGGRELSMNFIDLLADIQVGDVVLSSGMGEVYPKGFPIGHVQSIERDSAGLHLTARLKPSAHFSTLEEVLCLDYRPVS